MYQKGQEKKEEIYQNARELFYRQGYKKTTSKDIAAKSGCPVSLVHYYFKKKENILSDIYNDLHNNIDDLLRERVPEVFDDILLADALNNRVFLAVILDDPQNRRVYQEHLEKQSNYSLLNKYVYTVYDQYLGQYGVRLPTPMYKAYIIAIFGARRECSLEFLSGRLKMDTQELVSLVMGLFPRLIKLDQDFVDRQLARSLDYYKELDHSGLKLLV